MTLPELMTDHPGAALEFIIPSLTHQNPPMSNSKSSSAGGISTLGLLGVVFVTLKLCGVITWSWWWVTAPFWGGIALVAAIFLCCGIVFLGCMFGALIVSLFKK